MIKNIFTTGSVTMKKFCYYVLPPIGFAVFLCLFDYFTHQTNYWRSIGIAFGTWVGYIGYDYLPKKAKPIALAIGIIFLIFIFGLCIYIKMHP